MGFALVKGTRRPLAIVAWVLVPLATLALGASVWRSWQSYREHSSEQRAAMKVAAQETAIGRTARTLQLPAELSPISSMTLGVGQTIPCESNFLVIGCWSSPNQVSAVAQELSLAMTHVGLQHAVTRCSATDCLTGGSLPNGDGELVFDVSPVVDGAGTPAAPCEIQASSWPRGLYIIGRSDLYGATKP
jgi:hypothetical protein